VVPGDRPIIQGGFEERPAGQKDIMPARKEDIPSTLERSEDAKRAGIVGRSKMSKHELVRELKRHSDRESARARS
jgi:hypothetical protein